MLGRVIRRQQGASWNVQKRVPIWALTCVICMYLMNSSCYVFANQLEAGGKPSTWFPPVGLVEYLFEAEDIFS